MKAFDEDLITYVTTLRVEMLRETKEVSGPRGWGEGAITYATFEKEEDGSRNILMSLGGERYLISPKVIEEIYTFHQNREI